jgi:LAO/AO transport system kinase
MLLVEAAGFDVVIVETVGVGQSETAVADMVDMFLLLLAPGGGDELQGLKKGIVELADALIVNKADGDLKAAAGRTAADYGNALGLLHATTAVWKPPVLQCSALKGTGIAEIWQAALKYRKTMEKAGLWAERRAAQARAWLWAELSDSLMAALQAHPGVKKRLAALETEVAAGRVTPPAAAETLLAAFLGR